ncbi:hypothetical protein ACFY3J_37075 [Streptomyces sp. NPDC001231]|uniref:hypothetical protein n=1 Tax=Streptomyces sp. NPDC001231 TaxID=3364549 RepID=UPI0036B4C0AA
MEDAGLRHGLVVLLDRGDQIVQGVGGAVVRGFDPGPVALPVGEGDGLRDQIGAGAGAGNDGTPV